MEFKLDHIVQNGLNSQSITFFRNLT